MNVEYINPFIEASQTVLKQSGAIESRLGKVFIKESPYKGDNIAIIIGVTGKMRGQVIFSMTLNVATYIASQMMGGMPVETLDEMAKSAISELTNMILGNAATFLYNRGIAIDITPPSVLMGENLQISTSKMKTVCVPLVFMNEMTFEIDISVEE